MAHLRRLRRLVAGVAALMLFGGGRALGDISESVFVIRAESAAGAAEYRATVSNGDFYSDSGYHWVLAEPVMLRSRSGSLIGVLRSASVVCHEDPDVSLDFSVLSGDLF